MTNLPCFQRLVFSFSVASAERSLHNKMKLEANDSQHRAITSHQSPYSHDKWKENMGRKELAPSSRLLPKDIKTN